MNKNKGSYTVVNCILTNIITKSISDIIAICWKVIFNVVDVSLNKTNIWTKFRIKQPTCAYSRQPDQLFNIEYIQKGYLPFDKFHPFGKHWLLIKWLSQLSFDRL